MELLTLTEKIVNIAKDDAALQEKTKNMVLTLVVVATDGGQEREALTISIDKGTMTYVNGALDHPDFQIEISKDNFEKFITGKAGAMGLLMGRKLKIIKGSMGEIKKIMPIFDVLPKIGKELVAQHEQKNLETDPGQTTTKLPVNQSQPANEAKPTSDNEKHTLRISSTVWQI